MSTQKKVFAFWRNLDFDNHLRTVQLQKSSHLQKNPEKSEKKWINVYTTNDCWENAAKISIKIKF